VRKVVMERLAVAETDRLRYLIIDFEQADGIDFSAAVRSRCAGPCRLFVLGERLASSPGSLR
jgi:hypothetical protein